MPIFVPSNDWEDLNANVATTKNKKSLLKCSHVATIGAVIFYL